jgi:[histone H3]-lysine36 N-dimethyltransferase SETMAR
MLEDFVRKPHIILYIWCAMTFIGRDHLRHIMLYEFNKGENATKAAENIKKVYGVSSITIRKCQRWFNKFRLGNFSLKDIDRAGRKSKIDDEILVTALEKDKSISVRKLAFKVESSSSAIHRRLKKLGKVSKCGKWIPHALSEKNKRDRLDICIYLQRLQIQEPFLDKLVTGDEKLVLYQNISQKHFWVSVNELLSAQVRQNIHPKKFLFQYFGINMV